MVPEANGVIVLRVLPNTPAAKAGLRRGDVVTQVGDQKVTSADQLQGIVEASRLGESLQVKVLRGKEALQLPIRTAELENAA